MRSSLTVLFLIALLVPVAQAEEIVWTMDNPPLNEDIPVDFCAIFENATMVTVRVTGYGGGVFGTCADQEEMELNYEIALELNALNWNILTDISTGFDYERFWILWEGDDSFDPAQAVLRLGVEEPTFDGLGCFLTDVDPFAMHSVTITVTCESAVPTDRTSWSQVKALYR